MIVLKNNKNPIIYVYASAKPILFVCMYIYAQTKPLMSSATEELKMELNFSVLFKCFIPIIYLSNKIGLGTNLLIISNVSKAVILNRIAMKLNSESGYKSLLSQPDAKVSSVAINEDNIRTFLIEQRTKLPYEKIMKEALDFYVKTSELMTNDYSAKEILAKAWENEKNYYDSKLLDSGMRTDAFGILKMNSDTFFDTAKEIVGTISLISVEELKANGDEAIDYAIKKFSSRFLDQVKNEQFKEFIEDLKAASKNKIRELGLDDNSVFFKGHVNDRKTEKFIEVAEIDGAQNFIDFLRNNLKFEQGVHNDVDLSETEALKMPINDIPIPEIDDKQFKKWISTSAFDKIKAHLVNIDAHPESAHHLVGLRSLNIVHGLEAAIYPKFMVSDLIKADHFEILQNLCVDHGLGMKSVFAIDQENIFVAAFNKNENMFKWLELLISNGFSLKMLQKKALIKETVDNDDAKFLELLLKNRIVSLWEYMKDRGLTLFHLILIEQKENLNQYIINNQPICDPDMKIQYVPISDDSDTYSSASKSYWLPSYNKFKVHFPKFIRPDMCIKKGWDSLMIAAVTNNIEMFKILAKNGANSAGYHAIAPFLWDQGNNLALLSMYQK